MGFALTPKASPQQANDLEGAEVQQQDQTQHSHPSAQKGFSLRNGPCHYPEQNHPKRRFEDRPQPSRGRRRRYALIRIQESLCIHSRPSQKIARRAP